MSTSTEVKKVKIGVLGASGYTGAELVRLLLRHPRVEILAEIGGVDVKALPI